MGLFERMAAGGWLRQGDKALTISEVGAAALSALGIDLDALRKRRRQLACACPEWSERKPHLGGALGAALLETCKQAGWLRPSGASRALHVSPQGRRAIGRIAAP